MVFTNKPLNRILLHAGFWLLLFGFTYYYNALLPDAFSVTPAKYLGAIRSTVSIMIVYYPLIYLVLPKLFMTKKYVLGILAVLGLIVIYTVADFTLEMFMYKSCAICLATLKSTIPEYYQFLQSGMGKVVLLRIASLAIVYQFLAFISVPAGIKMSFAYFRERIRTLQLQQQNLNLEFNFLKAQINPHFLFNTLNNIYGLVLQDRKEQAAETIARLSYFMRYTLYDSNEHRNQVTREIQLMQDYITLEKLRLEDTLINFTYDLDKADYTIPPLLFLPLVENAFKYVSSENAGESWILIRLKISQGALLFDISNSFFHPSDKSTAAKGIGITNFVRRLESYFSGKAVHHISRENGIFKVSVKIPNL